MEERPLSERIESFLSEGPWAVVGASTDRAKYGNKVLRCYVQAGKEPVVEASIVKDIGTVWEQQLPHRVRDLAAFVEETATNRETLEKQLSFAIKTAPKLTIQGGTTEVLRGIIARGLGLR